MIEAQDAVDEQAQAGTLDVQVRDDVHVLIASAHVDWAAAKRISLSTADGANITMCPGKIAVHAGKKSLGGARAVPALPAILPPSAAQDLLRPMYRWFFVRDRGHFKQEGAWCYSRLCSCI